MDFCPNSVGFWVSTHGQERKIGRIRCKSWTCAYCGDMNRRVLIANTINVCETLQAQGYDLWFVTLTLASWQHRSGRGAQAAAANEAFNRYWHWLRNITRRSQAVEYIRFLERHQSGVFHIHAIMATRFDLSFKWYVLEDKRVKDDTRCWSLVRHKDGLVKCGLGHQADIQPLDSAKKAGFYALKYASKEVMAGYAVASGFRRFASSRAFALSHKDTPSRAEYRERLSIVDVVGYVVTDVDLNTRITTDVFMDAGQEDIGPSVDYRLFRGDGRVFE